MAKKNTILLIVLVKLILNHVFGVELTRSLVKSFGFDNYSTVMRFANQNITLIKDFAFSSFTNINTLYLSNNNLKSIGKSAFSGLYGLTDLEISGNNLQSIHPNAFDNLKNLGVLYLDNNQLTTLNINLFSFSLRQLKLLNLERNNLTKMESTLLRNLTNLRDLNLKSNQINLIEFGAFEDLNHLNQVCLACFFFPIFLIYYFFSLIFLIKNRFVFITILCG